jgi:hypothetical protein
MKVEQGPAALERFKTIVFETVFKVPGTFDVSTPQHTARIARRYPRRPARRGADGDRRGQAIDSKS